MAYFDASVIAAYYCPETLSAKAETALRGDAEPSISPLVEVELACAVARKVRDRTIGRADAARILAEFRAHLSQNLYRVVPVTPVHYSVAAGWVGSFEMPLRALDALHLAIAAELGESVITSDRQMAESARKLKVQCRVIR